MLEPERVELKCNDDYVGTWRITEMELWDQDFIDLVGPGQMVVCEDGWGSFSFGAVELDLECTARRSGKQGRITFTFDGFNEGDEVSGKGWAKLHNNELRGEIHFHLGDRSWFIHALREGQACSANEE